MNRDEVYAALVEMHRGLDERDSLLVSSRLILLLAERVGDERPVLRAIAEARSGLPAAART